MLSSSSLAKQTAQVESIKSSWEVGRPFPGGGLNALKRWTRNREEMADRLKRRLLILVARRKVAEQRRIVHARKEAEDREAWERELMRREAFARTLRRTLCSFCVPPALVALVLLLFWLQRCQGAHPLPAQCASYFAILTDSSVDAVLELRSDQNWRSRVDCCHGQVVTIHDLPLRAATIHDFVGLQWYEGSPATRFVSYRRLTREEASTSSSSVSFPVGWNLEGRAWSDEAHAGGNSIPCMPRADRDCQYGDTPLIEVAALQFNVDLAAGGGAQTDSYEVPWSWGKASLRPPAGIALGSGASSGTLFLASFPPEFTMQVPMSLPTEVPSFARRLEPMPPSDTPAIERYPTPHERFARTSRFASAVAEEGQRAASLAFVGGGAPMAGLIAAAMLLVLVAKRWDSHRQPSLRLM